MKKIALWIIALTTLSGFALYGQQTPDTSAHKVQFVTVDKDVKLEVLDWGGAGRPLVFLAGMGNTAHNFDTFGPKFTAKNHVYGITRRGFGASSKPVPTTSNYAADRLGDDVLAVMDALKLHRPILVGHSFGGEELSSVGSRYPEKVAGLIYLDAASGWAYYDPKHPDWVVDMTDLEKQMDDLKAGGLRDEQQFLREMETSASQFAKSLHEYNKQNATMPPMPPRSPIIAALTYGEQKYTEIPVSILAIFACPHNWDRAFPHDSPAKATRIADDLASCSARAEDFAAGIPTAHVVTLPNADHFVFNSNEAEVVREMNAFLAKLP
jgi:pimeloyl-ACP methyl ester carboxylesterase